MAAVSAKELVASAGAWASAMYAIPSTKVIETLGASP